MELEVARRVLLMFPYKSATMGFIVIICIFTTTSLRASKHEAKSSASIERSRTTALFNNTFPNSSQLLLYIFDMKWILTSQPLIFAYGVERSGCSVRRGSKSQKIELNYVLMLNFCVFNTFLTLSRRPPRFPAAPTGSQPRNHRVASNGFS